MIGIRYKPNGKYFRAAQAGNTVNLVADGDLKTGTNLLILPDLWTATQWVESRLRGQPIELVELEMREVRVIAPVLDRKPDETTGNQFPIVGGVRP